MPATGPAATDAVTGVNANTFRSGRQTWQDIRTAANVTTIRRSALRHALLSYLFGAVILAGAINLVAGLTR